jgi:hypothetical protein
MKAHGTEPQHFVREKNNEKPFKPFFGNESQKKKKEKIRKKGSNKNNGTIVSRECHRRDKLISVPCLITYSPLSTTSDFRAIYFHFGCTTLDVQDLFLNTDIIIPEPRSLPNDST